MVGIRENGNPTAAEPLTAFYLGVAMTEGLSTITAVERRTCTAALTGSENRKIRTAYLLLGVYLVPGTQYELTLLRLRTSRTY